jgi:S-adenosylmethionine decarboxylase
MINYIGQHLIADLYGVNSQLLMNENKLINLLGLSLKKSNFTIINQVSFKFPGEKSGVTGFFLLSESHAAFHTYPEYSYIALDIFSCGNSDLESMFLQIINGLSPCFHQTKVDIRGQDYTLDCSCKK